MGIVVPAEDASVKFRVRCEAGVIERVAQVIARAPGANVAGVEAPKLGGVLEVVVPRRSMGPDAGADVSRCSRPVPCV